MFRIAACFMLLAITVTNAFADDDVSTDISDKQSLPKSYVIEVTRLVMKESTDSVAGLSGARLDAQIRQWQEADQIASEESLSLTSVENFKASVQFGRRVAVVTGSASFGGSRSRQSNWQDMGTIGQATITSQEGHVIAELTYESSTYDPNEDADTPGETLTITISTHLVLKPGEKQVISNSRANGRTVLLVEVSEVGQARTTPSRTSASGRRPDPRGRPTSRPGVSTQDRLGRFVAAMFQRYDKNQDGILNQGEVNAQSSLSGRFDEIDRDKDGKVTSSELNTYFEKRTRR